MRRAYHVARADLLQRVRSRKLVIVLAVVAFLGYLVNVGQIELAYQVETATGPVNVHGADTAAFVGLKAGLTGATVLLFGGFYLMNATLARDRRHHVDRLVASTALTDRRYLLGKWLSNLALAGVVLIVLGIATVLNHLVHGVGPTAPLALLGPIVVFAVPVGALVGAVALLFEAVDPLDGTGGNVAYFLLASFVLGGLSAADGRLPSALPVWLKAIDTLGQLAVYELTVDALRTAVPAYAGGPPSFGTLDATRAFTYTGHRWPAWVFLQRLWLLVPAVALLLAATVPVQQLGARPDAARSRWRSRLAELLGRSGTGSEPDAATADPTPVNELSFTAVTDRETGRFRRLVVAELRLSLRGRRWWWYVGAVALVLYPLGGLLPAGVQPAPVAFVRRLFLPLVVIWPIFVWSDIGTRLVRHRLTDLVYTSRYASEQLLAEWLAGVAVGLAVSSGVGLLLVVTGTWGGLLGLLSGTLFGPSLAVAIGTWSRSSELFELTYLLLWYAGPLNGGEAVDFVGATGSSVELGVPIAFIGLSVLLAGAGLYRRKRMLG